MTALDVTVDIDVDDPGPAGVPGARRPESHRRVRRTVLRLSWQQDDPLAVRLQLISTPDHPALPRGSWVVLRDFLRYGLEEATGDGEVRISPLTPGRDIAPGHEPATGSDGTSAGTTDGDGTSAGDSTQGVVAIRLARDGRPAWVQVPCASVRDFLDRTEVVTPSGEESSEEALDALIKALLRA